VDLARPSFPNDVDVQETIFVSDSEHSVVVPEINSPNVDDISSNHADG